MSAVLESPNMFRVLDSKEFLERTTKHEGYFFAGSINKNVLPQFRYAVYTLYNKDSSRFNDYDFLNVLKTYEEKQDSKFLSEEGPEEDMSFNKIQIHLPLDADQVLNEMIYFLAVTEDFKYFRKKIEEQIDELNCLHPSYKDKTGWNINVEDEDRFMLLNRQSKRLSEDIRNAEKEFQEREQKTNSNS